MECKFNVEFAAVAERSQTSQPSFPYKRPEASWLQGQSFSENRGVASQPEIVIDKNRLDDALRGILR